MIDPALEPPILVFGGPYSNLRALAALRRHAEALAPPPSHCIRTGDVVAYCATHPQAHRSSRTSTSGPGPPMIRR
jgi:hypothetical protein